MTSKLLSAAAALVFFVAASPHNASAAVSCGAALLSGVTTPIYVSPNGNDTPSCGGAPADACASIQHGIGRCGVSGCGVLVRYGLYKTTATITLRDGVSVYGSCVFDKAGDARYRTVVQATPASGMPAISANAISTPTTVYGLVVIGKDETAPGAASVAMAVGNSSGLALRAMVLLSGQGGPGRDGTTNASPVGNGEGATPADPNNWQYRGVGGRSCPSNHTTEDGNGGLGGTADFSGSKCNNWIMPSAGNPSGSVNGGPAGFPGQGGNWCTDIPSYSPTSGTNGIFGYTGGAGAPAMASPLVAGSIVQTAWQPSKGNDGQAGAVGSGGGGGGPGGSCYWYYGGGGYHGYAGAAGGGGGCGGSAGSAGQQGGASIALILSASRVDFGEHSLGIIAGAGGGGGKGGSSGSGGAGGAGGAGVQNNKLQNLYGFGYCVGLSGNGGQGGDGGPGSGAAGGNGGPSIGIALAGNSPPPTSDSGIYVGVPGNGGGGGAGGPAVARWWGTVPAGPDGQDGSPGKAAASFKY
jgi:hypothetical protein